MRWIFNPPLERQLVSMQGVFLFFFLAIFSALVGVTGSAICFGCGMVVVGSAVLKGVREE